MEVFQKIEGPGHLLKIRCLLVAEAVLETAQLGVLKRRRFSVLKQKHDPVARQSGRLAAAQP